MSFQENKEDIGCLLKLIIGIAVVVAVVYFGAKDEEKFQERQMRGMMYIDKQRQQEWRDKEYERSLKEAQEKKASKIKKQSTKYTSEDAYEEGYDQGYEQGMNDATNGEEYANEFDDTPYQDSRHAKQYAAGYQEGYDDGYNDGASGE